MSKTDNAQPSLRRTIIGGNGFFLRDEGHGGRLKEGGKGEAVEASLPHYAMAACSAAADTKWSRESWDRKGVGADGKVGEMGTVKTAAQRGGSRRRHSV